MAAVQWQNGLQGVFLTAIFTYENTANRLLNLTVSLLSFAAMSMAAKASAAAGDGEEEYIVLDFGTDGPLLESCESYKLIVCAR